MPSLKPLSVSALAVLAAVGAVSTPVGAAPHVPAAVPASPLAHARTIRVHEQFKLYNTKNSQFDPFFNNTVLISRPGKIKVIAGQMQPGRKPHIYVADGKTEREYNALTNTYQTLTPRPNGTTFSELRDMSRIDLILNGAPSAPGPKVQRIVSSETLDGRAMTVTMDRQPPATGRDGSTNVPLTKIWVDAKTRLPYRWGFFVDTNGKMNPVQELDFSGWVLNRPIPPAQIAWAPPAGSKPYTEPVLLAAGTPAPDFTAIAPDGHKVHLSDYKGKTVVLDFWATWCGPCQRSMPELEKMYQQIKDKDVVVLGVCVWDEKGAYDKWVMANIGTKYNFPVAFDPAGHGSGSIAGSLYKVTGIPTQYVIDKDGKVAAAYTGYSDGDTRLEKALTAQGVPVQAVAAAAAVTKVP